jgi:uncharacterized damage-inducible protein DinB
LRRSFVTKSAPSSATLRAGILDAWSTSARVTAFLIEGLPPDLWSAPLPGSPRRTVRMLAGHIHNARCMWIKTLGRPHGIRVPAPVDRRRVTRAQLAGALGKSAGGIAALLELGLDSGGSIPPTASYVWRNLPLDVAHVLGYFVAHEGHHRGQIVMAARAIGQRLPAAVTSGLWQWTRLSGRSAASRRGR